MKTKRIFFIILFTLVIIFIQGCKVGDVFQSVEGIDEPITIDGIDIIVKSVESKSQITIGGQIFSPNSADDNVFIVTTEVSTTSFEEINENGWDIYLKDENGKQEKPSVTSFSTGIINGESSNELELIFASNKNSKSFSLFINESEFVLDSILNLE